LPRSSVAQEFSPACRCPRCCSQNGHSKQAGGRAGALLNGPEGWAGQQEAKEKFVNKVIKMHVKQKKLRVVLKAKRSLDKE
ncbi:Hypothetical predicted protein, partial [Marmota monax]